MARQRSAPEVETSLSRRAFVARAVVATGALSASISVLRSLGLTGEAAASTGVVNETFDALVAFVVPGNDAHSIAQGVSTDEPGGIAAFASPALVQGLDFASPFPPDLSGTVATLLNTAAQLVAPGSTTGPFTAPFANLSFAEKAAALAVLESAEPFAPLRSLFGVLPALAAFLSYSEVGVFDPATRSLVGQPVGWRLSSYSGVADGRNALVGYLDDRRKADA